MKLACVVHRFGADIAGGSEGHCRLIAEHLAARHDVTILTTCAKDHITWANHYPAGESQLVSPKPGTGEGGRGQLRVLRFPVARERDMRRFMDLSDLIAADQASAAEQEQWFRENGPDAPGLLEHLRAHGAEYDRVLFWAYRYANSFFGVPLVADRAILVPTAEEDPLIHADVLEPFFALPRGFLFLTPEEEALVAARAPAGKPSAIIGSGLDPAPEPGTPGSGTLNLPTPFVLYLGRVDPNKGCQALIRHFLRYVEGGRQVTLVMAGPASMEIPEHPLIRPLGFVDDGVREALLRGAQALIMPSPYESLSMVLLEAWNHALPALVNARCKVLRGQVERADGGLYYGNAVEFIAGLDYLLDHRDVAAALGRQGLAYVDREYRWPIVVGKIEALLAAV